MPTRLHHEHEIEPVIKPDENGVISIKDIEASDGIEPKILINLTLFPTKDIEATAIFESGQQLDKLKLKYLDSRRNGLFLYEYEISEHNYFFDRTKKNIIHILYHSIKSFYHVHERLEDGDGILTPYCSEHKTELDSPNNQALMHYLGEFEKIFIAENELWTQWKVELDKRYSEIINDLERECKQKKITVLEVLVREKLTSIELFKSFIKSQYEERIFEFSKLLKMHIYYQTLFYSKYNKLFKIDLNNESSSYILNSKCLKTSRQKRSLITLTPHNENTNLTDIDYCKKAINIHNSIESIKILKNDFIEKNHIALSQLIYYFSHKTSRSSTINTIRYALIGIAAGVIISALFFFIQQFAYSPEKDINKLETINIVIQEKLREIQTDQTENIKELKKLIEELNQKLKEEKTNTQQ